MEFRGLAGLFFGSILIAATGVGAIAVVNLLVGNLVWPNRTDPFEILLYSLTVAGPALFGASFAGSFYAMQYARTREQFWATLSFVTLLVLLGCFIATIVFLPKSNPSR